MTEIYFVRHSKFDKRMMNNKNETLPLTKEGIKFAKKVLNIPELILYLLLFVFVLY